MKIYLAAPYGEMLRMREWKDKLWLAGHICTARWLVGTEEGMPRSEAAQMDFDDIDAADAVVSMILPKGTMFSSGGRHVEFGYGLAKGKLMIVVGTEAENVFHHHSDCLMLPTIDHVIRFLEGVAHE